MGYRVITIFQGNLKYLVPIPWLAILFLCSGSFVYGSEAHLRVGMFLWRGETAAETGFRERLSRLGYRVEYDVFDSDQNLKRLGDHLRSINSRAGTYDYIYTFGTTVSRRAKVVVGGKIPQLFNVVTDPVAAGIVDSYERPGDNISGASDYIPVSHQLSFIEQLLTIEKLGLFFNPREKNSMIFRKELRAAALEKGVSVVEFRTPPERSALTENLQKIAAAPDLVDAVLLAPDSYLSSESTFIGTQLRKAGIKSIGSVRDQVENGVLIGIVADYYRLGSAVADILDQHQRGDELGTIPVERIQGATMVVNQTTADLLGVDVRMIDNEHVLIVD